MINVDEVSVLPEIVLYCGHGASSAIRTDPLFLFDDQYVAGPGGISNKDADSTVDPAMKAKKMPSFCKFMSICSRLRSLAIYQLLQVASLSTVRSSTVLIYSLVFKLDLYTNQIISTKRKKLMPLWLWSTSGK